MALFGAAVSSAGNGFMILGILRLAFSVPLMSKAKAITRVVTLLLGMHGGILKSRHSIQSRGRMSLSKQFYLLILSTT